MGCSASQVRRNGTQEQSGVVPVGLYVGRKNGTKQFDPNNENRFIIQYYNGKHKMYLKLEPGNLVGSYLTDLDSSLCPYCAVFRKHIVLEQSRPVICHTITYTGADRRSRFTVSITPDFTLELLEDIRPAAFLHCLFKLHQNSAGLMKLESMMYNGVYLFVDNDTNKAVFRVHRQLSDLPSQLFRLFPCPDRTVSTTTIAVNRFYRQSNRRLCGNNSDRELDIESVTNVEWEERAVTSTANRDYVTFD
ncbi:uncharacterized protein LOC117342603 [Pecten maximus]|uniref:uncharacterized protein LOC117342603 n=1 Tax=Pecten maximus TaxID=6579 RepID=UPI00145891ED|nr:uncharacterized protein LOC117342603 [Pecten maximus]